MVVIDYAAMRGKLREMYYRDRVTQKELAQRFGCSHQYVSQLLSGDASFSRVSLELFFRIFPDADIVFGEGGHSVTVARNANSAVAVGDGASATNNTGADAAAMTAAELLELVMAAADEDIPPTVKIAVWRLYNNRGSR